ncbi:MAG: glutathione S-transferase [Flavobacteriales bacterium]|jgi:glutathione S-transferase
MYTLYYIPGACSLATQVVLHELNQAVEIIDAQKLDGFKRINPVGTVPVLIDEGQVLSEGAAVMLHILQKHKSPMLPGDAKGFQQSLQDIMFANATMHPAYGRLFFIAANITSGDGQDSAFKAASVAINNLWSVVESKLAEQTFLGGETPSAADIMLAVYSRWGASFPVKISLAERTKNMLDAVISMPNFQRAINAEQQPSV